MSSSDNKKFTFVFTLSLSLTAHRKFLIFTANLKNFVSLWSKFEYLLIYVEVNWEYKLFAFLWQVKEKLGNIFGFPYFFYKFSLVELVEKVSGYLNGCCIPHCPKYLGTFRDIEGNVTAKKLYTWEKFEIGNSLHISEKFVIYPIPPSLRALRISRNVSWFTFLDPKMPQCARVEFRWDDPQAGRTLTTRPPILHVNNKFFKVIEKK